MRWANEDWGAEVLTEAQAKRCRQYFWLLDCLHEALMAPKSGRHPSTFRITPDAPLRHGMTPAEATRQTLAENGLVVPVGAWQAVLREAAEEYREYGHGEFVHEDSLFHALLARYPNLPESWDCWCGDLDSSEDGLVDL